MSTEKNHEDAGQVPEQGQEQQASEMEATIEAEPLDHQSRQQAVPEVSNTAEQEEKGAYNQQTADDTTVVKQTEPYKARQSESDQNNSVQGKSGIRGWIIPLLAMFILFAGGGALLWLEQQQLGQRLQQSEQRGQALQSQLDKGQQQQLQALNANSELQRSMQAMQDLAIAQQQAPQKDETTLLLHQALMLVRMAQAQLQVRQNVADAVLALQWAQQRMQAQNDSRIVPVLVQLGRDLQQLNNLPERTNLAQVQQLASLIDAVDKLPLRIAAAQSLEPAAEPEPQPAPEYTDWRSALQIVWQELKQLVVIRHRDQPIQPLMSAERKQILHDVLRLRLEALQVQLMREAVAAQNVARARALSWLREWFDEGSADVISMRAWLNDMPQTATALPDLQGSVDAITAAMEQASPQAGPAP